MISLLPTLFKDKKSSWLLYAYCPRLVTKIIDGLEGVDARDAAVLQTDDQVAKIFILGHTEGVLANENKVWLEGSGEQNNRRNVTKTGQSVVDVDESG